MIRFTKSLAAWKTPQFEFSFKQEVRLLHVNQLPLQAGLAQTSYVIDSGIEPMILKTSETADVIRIKAGVFYAGVIAGSCCADDPTPVCEQTEYCELQFEINKRSAQVTIVLLATEH